MILATSVGAIPKSRGLAWLGDLLLVADMSNPDNNIGRGER